MGRILIFFTVLYVTITTLAQTNNDAASATPEALARNVVKSGSSLPQEKVFLHLDNTCYFLGDTIWYKAYVDRKSVV